LVNNFLKNVPVCAIVKKYNFSANYMQSQSLLIHKTDTLINGYNASHMMFSVL